MGYFASRAVAAASPSSPTQDRADIFARGEAAVLVVADGAGAEPFVDAVRRAVIDPTFDLLVPSEWDRLFTEAATATVVVLSPGCMLVVATGRNGAWMIGADVVVDLTDGPSRVRGELEGRLIVASDGLFRHVARDQILAIVRAEKFGRVGDALIGAARLPSGHLADDIAVLVAEA